MYMPTMGIAMVNESPVPRQSALTPSSLAIRRHASVMPLLYERWRSAGSVGGRDCILVLTTSNGFVTVAETTEAPAAAVIW